MRQKKKIFIKLSAECFPHGCKLSPGQMAFPRIGGLLVTSLEKKKSAPFNLQIRQMSNSSLEMSILIDLLSSFWENMLEMEKNIVYFPFYPGKLDSRR